MELQEPVTTLTSHRHGSQNDTSSSFQLGCLCRPVGPVGPAPSHAVVLTSPGRIVWPGHGWTGHVLVSWSSRNTEETLRKDTFTSTLQPEDVCRHLQPPNLELAQRS